MNDFLVDIVIFVNNVVGVFIVVRFMNHLLVKKRINEIAKRLGIVGVLLVATIVNILLVNLLTNIWGGFLFFFMIGNLFYEGKYHLKLVIAIFIVVFSIITELLTAIVFGAVFGEVIQGVRGNIRYLLLGGIVSKVLLMLLVEVIIRFRRRSDTNVSLSSWLFIISIPIISIVLLFLVIYEPVMNNVFSEITFFFKLCNTIYRYSGFLFI